MSAAGKTGRPGVTFQSPDDKRAMVDHLVEQLHEVLRLNRRAPAAKGSVSGRLRGALSSYLDHCPLIPKDGAA